MNNLYIVHKIYFLLLVLAKKNNPDIKKSKEIASFLFSIYLTLFVIAFFFLIKIFINNWDMNKNMTNAIMIGIPILNYLICSFYFSFNNRYIKIYKKMIINFDNIEHFKKHFIIFNVVFFNVIILIPLLYKIIFF